MTEADVIGAVSEAIVAGCAAFLLVGLASLLSAWREWLGRRR